MASDPGPFPVMAMVTAISDLTGMDVGQIQGYVLVIVDQEGEVGVISTATDPLSAIGALAIAISKLAGEPAPDLLISDSPT